MASVTSSPAERQEVNLCPIVRMPAVHGWLWAPRAADEILAVGRRSMKRSYCRSLLGNNRLALCHPQLATIFMPTKTSLAVIAFNSETTRLES